MVVKSRLVQLSYLRADNDASSSAAWKRFGHLKLSPRRVFGGVQKRYKRSASPQPAYPLGANVCPCQRICRGDDRIDESGM